MTETAESTVTRNEDKSRYELHLGDVLAGFTEFHPDSKNRLVFDKTEIDHAFAGRGLGKTLASEALADVARRGDVVVPVCSFIVKYLKENEVAGLVVDWRDDNAAQDAATPGESPA